MAYGSRGWKTALRMARLIHALPNPMDKPYQECSKEEKASQLMRLAFREITGNTYTEQFYQDNKRYL